MQGVSKLWILETSFSRSIYLDSMVLAIRTTSLDSSIVPDLGGQKNIGFILGKILTQPQRRCWSKCLPIFLASLGLLQVM